MLRYILSTLALSALSITTNAQIGIQMPKDSSKEEQWFNKPKREQWFSKPSADTAHMTNRMPIVKPDTIAQRKMPVAKPSGNIQYK